MRTNILQPWLTVRADATAVSQVLQDVEGWLDVAGAQDVTFWIDVRELTVSAGASIKINLETSPTRDESAFTALSAPLSLSASLGSSGVPFLLKSTRCKTTSPVGRYIRWRLSSDSTGIWDICFRIRVAFSRTQYFVPTDITGCVLWLRSDLGITLVSGQVSAWADQSGAGNDAAQATAGNRPGYSPAGGVNSLPTLLGSVIATRFMTGTFSSATQFTDHTAFATIKHPATLSNSAAIAGCDVALTVNTSFSLFTGTPGGIFGRLSSAIGNNADATTADTSPPSLGNASIYSSAGSSSIVDIYINGTAMNVNNAPGQVQGPAKTFAVMALNGAGTYANSSELYEIVVYNRVLAANERTRVHRYLGGRYGISVP